MRRVSFIPKAKMTLPLGSPLANGIHVVPAADTPPVEVRWFIHNWLAAGKLHLLAGAPSTGKTTVAMQLIAYLTNGRIFWLDGSPISGGNVLVWSGEDGIEDTLIPRLISAGANMQYVHIVHGTVEQRRQRTFDFAKDFPLLKAKIEEIGNVVLVVIDSIAQIVSGDSNKNSDVRRALAPLLELGETYGCAILGITHVNKNSSGKAPLDRVTGSLAYGAAARVVMFTVQIKSDDPETPKTCMLVRAKSNIGPDDGGYEYQIVPASFEFEGKTFNSSRVVFNTEMRQGSAKDIIKYAESGGTVNSSNSAVNLAAEFLLELLAHGGMTYQAIEEHAKAANIALSALKRAKSVLDIRSEKQVGSGLANPPTMWKLPEQPMATQPHAATGAPKYRGPSEQPHHRESAETQQPESSPEVTPASQRDSVDPVAPVDAVAPATAPPEATNGLNKSLLDLCSWECRRLLDHATSSSDDDALSSVDEIVEAAIKRFVGESAPGNKLIEKYRNALRQLDIFRNLE